MDRDWVNIPIWRKLAEQIISKLKQIIPKEIISVANDFAIQRIFITVD